MCALYVYVISIIDNIILSWAGQAVYDNNRTRREVSIFARQWTTHGGAPQVGVECGGVRWYNGELSAVAWLCVRSRMSTRQRPREIVFYEGEEKRYRSVVVSSLVYSIKKNFFFWYLPNILDDFFSPKCITRPFLI